MPHAPRRILVLCTRRLGDVLLATALLRSLRRAYPAARIEVAVNTASVAVLDGNPDVDQVIAVPERSSWRASLKLAWRILRRYQLAISTLSSDRSQILAWLAAPRRVGVVPEAGQPGTRWKRRLMDAWTPVDLHVTHAVVQYLRLADALGIPRVAQLVPPRPASPVAVMAPGAAYAVVHPSPMYRYKAWPDGGWTCLIQALRQRGLQVAVTGGPSQRERAHVAQLLRPFASDPQVIDCSGRLSFAELTPLLEGAAVYVGPDTSVTHLAAACGVPTVALYGPSNPSAWGPWPRGCSSPAPSPWVHTSAVQQLGNVWLLQGTHGRYGACIPCMQEGCERNHDSPADCLDTLQPARVIAAVDEALRSRAAGGSPPGG